MRLICFLAGVLFAPALLAMEPSTKLRLVADLQPGPNYSSPGNFFEWNGKVWFRASSTKAGKDVTSLYCTDGSTAGTRCIKDFSEGLSFENPVVFENRLYFQGPNSAPGKGNRIWVTDGTEAGTQPLSQDGKDVCDEAKPFLLGERLMLFVHGGVKRHDLIALNLHTGTEEPVAVPFAAAEDYSEGPVKLGEHVLMVNEEGTGLWRMDGTRSGLKKLSLPGMPIIQGDDGIKQLASLPGGVLILPNGSKQPWELWHTDGTVGWKVVSWTWPKSRASASWFGRVGERALLYAADRSRRTGLWSSDGTTQGSKLLLDLDPYRDASFSFGHDNVITPVVAGGRLYFVLDDGKHGLELWCSDGTATGTRLVMDIAPGETDANIRHISATSSGLVLIECRSENKENSIWITDGSEAGTRNLASLGKQIFSELHAFKNMLLMDAVSAEFGSELWALDLPENALKADAVKGTKADAK